MEADSQDRALAEALHVIEVKNRELHKLVAPYVRSCIDHSIAVEKN